MAVEQDVRGFITAMAVLSIGRRQINCRNKAVIERARRSGRYAKRSGVSDVVGDRPGVSFPLPIQIAARYSIGTTVGYEADNIAT